MRIEKTIKIGDILTSLAIIISVFALLNAWSQERFLRQKEHADKIRNAAAKTLAKLERWQELSMWIFQDAQPLFVETSEMVTKNFDTVSGRDFLWKGLNNARMKNLQRLMDEEIEIAYVDLYSYHPAIRSLFTNTIDQLKKEEELMFNRLLEETQADIIAFAKRKNEYTTAMIDNALRATAAKHQNSYNRRMTKILGRIDNVLAKLILISDEDLLKGGNFSDQ